MNVAEILRQAQTRLQSWAQTDQEPVGNRLDISIHAEDLLSTVLALHTDHWGYLAAITGLDLGPDDGGLEILYHFCEGPAVLTLRVYQPRANPAVPSLTTLVPLAAFYERELREMLGVTIVGLNAPEYLYLPEDWPAGVYPLRRDTVLPLPGGGV